MNEAGQKLNCFVQKENFYTIYVYRQTAQTHLSLINYCEIGIYLSFISLQIFFTRQIVKYLRVKETLESTQFFTYNELARVV